MQRFFGRNKRGIQKKKHQLELALVWRTITARAFLMADKHAWLGCQAVLLGWRTAHTAQRLPQCGEPPFLNVGLPNETLGRGVVSRPRPLTLPPSWDQDRTSSSPTKGKSMFLMLSPLSCFLDNRQKGN